MRAFWPSDAIHLRKPSFASDPGDPSVPADAFVPQASPKNSNYDVFGDPAFAVHTDAQAGSEQAVDFGGWRELRSLLGAHDLGRTDEATTFVQHLDAEGCLQCVRD